MMCICGKHAHKASVINYDCDVKYHCKIQGAPVGQDMAFVTTIFNIALVTTIFSSGYQDLNRRCIG